MFQKSSKQIPADIQMAQCNSVANSAVQWSDVVCATVSVMTVQGWDNLLAWENRWISARQMFGTTQSFCFFISALKFDDLKYLHVEVSHKEHQGTAVCNTSAWHFIFQPLTLQLEYNWLIVVVDCRLTELLCWINATFPDVSCVL